MSAAPLLETPRLRLRPFVESECPSFELGWLLGREHWGRSYEREEVALRHAFDALRRELVISLIRPVNERFISVALAIGERVRGEAALLGSRALV